MANQETENVEISEDYQKMKVTELRKLLKERALPATGTKDELVERLKRANEAAEKLLDESGEEHNVEAEAGSIDEELENEIMNEEKVTTTISPVAVKRKPTENGDSEPPNKKLEKNNQSETIEGEEIPGEVEGETQPNGKEKSPENSSRIIKLSDNKTKDELLEMRAKKFGLNADDKKALRAKRFGLETKPSEEPKVKGPATEVLKKRAERFGAVSSAAANKTKITVGTNSVDEEKMKKRAERFGITTLPQIDINKKVQVDKANPILSKTLDQRKQLRANRFRTS